MCQMNGRDILAYIPVTQYRYYYSGFDSSSKKLYLSLLEGYASYRSHIVIKSSCLKEVWEIHNAICNDIPEIFFIKNIRVTYNPIVKIGIVLAEYRFDKSTTLEILKVMEISTKNILQEVSMLGEEDKVKRLHDYLIRNVKYKDMDAPYSHEAAGALIYGIAVCEGVSKAFKYLTDRIDMDSIIVVGRAEEYQSDDIQNSESQIGHAWNIVYIKGVPYHIDITFDQTISSENCIRYDYFMLADAQVEVDHQYEDILKCTKINEYYENRGFFVENRGKLEYLVEKELCRNKILVFKMQRFTEEIEQIVKHITKIVTKTLLELGVPCRNISISYNQHRMIFQVEIYT